MDFPGGSDGKESACNVGDLVLIPGLGGSPREGKDYPLQYSGLENSMDASSMGSQRARHDRLTFTFQGLHLGSPLSRMSLISTRGPPILSASAQMSVLGEPFWV